MKKIRRAERPRATTPAPEAAELPKATRRQWFSGAAGAAIGGTAFVAETTLRPRSASAQAGQFVDLTSNQTISGAKTFTSPPVVPARAFPQSAIAGLEERFASQPAESGAYAATPAGKPATALVTDSTAQTKTGKLTLSSLSALPFTIDAPEWPHTTNLAEVIGTYRDGEGGAGSPNRYRIHVDWNGGLAMNTALTIQGSSWMNGPSGPGTLPPPIGDQITWMLGIEDDVAGPSLLIKAGGLVEAASGTIAPHIRCLDINNHKSFEVRSPSVGGGAWCGIGDTPISTLTLSNKWDQSQPTSLTIRHNEATARLGFVGTGILDLSNNFLAKQNSLGEHAMTLDALGVGFYGAPTPGAARSEILFISRNGARLNTGGFLINQTDGISLFLALEPGTGNIRFRTKETGAGAGVLAMRNAAVPPSTNPVGGGILYADGGHLKWRDGAGVIFDTTRQPALPDTNGATLSELEREINGLKIRLRAVGLMA